MKESYLKSKCLWLNSLDRRTLQRHLSLTMLMGQAIAYTSTVRASNLPRTFCQQSWVSQDCTHSTIENNSFSHTKRTQNPPGHLGEVLATFYSCCNQPGQQVLPRTHAPSSHLYSSSSFDLQVEKKNLSFETDLKKNLFQNRYGELILRRSDFGSSVHQKNMPSKTDTQGMKLPQVFPLWCKFKQPPKFNHNNARGKENAPAKLCKASNSPAAGLM